MDARKIEKLKNENPYLKKLHKCSNTLSFFNNQFEIISDDPLTSASYIFDESKNIFELQ